MIYSIYLITHKLTREKYIHVLINEKDIHRHYSPREHLIELIEKQSSKQLIASRRSIWTKTYGDYIFRSDVYVRRNARGFKRPRKSISMRLNNPNKNGLSDLHKKRIGDSNRGKRKTGRKPWSEERKKWQSAVMKKYKNAKGWFWIVNVVTDEEKRINQWPIPSGWRRGRSVTKTQEWTWARKNRVRQDPDT